MIKCILGSTMLVILFSAAGCAPTNVVPTFQYYDPVDAVQPYTQRSNTTALDAGDAQAVNTRIQEIDPWPRYVGNRRIPADGGRMTGAMERYEKSKGEPLATVSTSSGSSGSSGSSK
jgi:hypothetical protein